MAAMGLAPIIRRGIHALVSLGLAALLGSVAAMSSGQATADRATDSATPAAALAGPLLAKALRNGGYILYFRHTATDFGQNDERMTGFEDCATQRNLTDAGRADARAVGAAIRTLGIYLEEGEAAVVEPLGVEGFRVVARIRKDGWADLAAY